MTVVTSTSTQTYTILNDMDIDWGATLERTNKTVTLRCIPLEPEIKDDGTGMVFDYSAPVLIEVYVRDNRARGRREEPQILGKLEKDLVRQITTNKFGLQSEGISHMVVRDTQIRPVDPEEYGLSNWYKLSITVLMQYRLMFVAV